MKNLLGIIVGLFLLASCSGGNSSKINTGDSVTTLGLTEDTISQQEGATKIDNVSFSQDTPVVKETENKEDSKKFYAAIPNYKKFFSDQGYGDLDRYLKSLGYKGSTKRVSTIDGPELKGNFKFEDGEKSISIKYSQLMGGMNSQITITGDEKALSDFYKKAKKLQGNEDWWECKVSKKGNTVIIDGGMD